MIAVEAENQLLQVQEAAAHRSPSVLRSLATATALTLAAAGCGPLLHTDGQGPQQYPSANSGDNPAPQTTAKTYLGPDGIHTVDFDNIAIETDSCQDSSVPWADRLIGGSGTQSYGNYVTTISKVGEIAYGDLTGDGNDEAIFTLKCEPSEGRPRSYFPLVFSIEDGQPKQIATLVPPAVYGAVVIEPREYRFSSGKLVEKELIYLSGASTQAAADTTLAWSWDGTQFIAHDIKFGDTTTTTEQDTATANIIDEHGIGRIRLGMRRGDVEKLGYSFTSGCGTSEGVEGGPGPMGIVFSDKTEYGLVHTIEIETDDFQTPEGVTIGTTLADAKRLLGSKITTEERHDVNGPYTLIRRPLSDRVEEEFIVVSGKVKLILEAPLKNDIEFC